MFEPTTRLATLLQTNEQILQNKYSDQILQTNVQILQNNDQILQTNEQILQTNDQIFCLTLSGPLKI